MKTTCPVIEDYPSFLPGGMAPCCFPVMDPVDVSPEEFWKSPQMEELRKQHREGNPPDICKTCVAVNEVTGFRQHTGTNPTNELKFETISISHSSICNRACRMCKSNLSTTLSGLKGEGSKPISNKYFRDTVIKYRDNVKSVFVGGGNPYQDDEVWEILELLNTDTVEFINATSNGSVVEDKHLKVLSRFKRAIVAFSIDGDKEVNETMRVFTKQERTYELIRETQERIKQYPNIEVCIQPTTTNVSIWRFKELYDEIEANCDVDSLLYSDNVCFWPEHYAPWNLSEEKRKELFHKLASDAAYLFTKRTKFADRMVSDIIKIEKLIRIRPVDEQLIKKFEEETRKFDLMSKTNLIEIHNVY